MRLADLRIAMDNKLPVVLKEDESLPWLVMDIGYRVVGNTVFCPGENAIALVPLEGGKIKRVGESEIVGLAELEEDEDDFKVTGFSTK